MAANSYKPRIPVAPEYAQAYGQAAYNFTYLEWAVIWSVEKLRKGYVNKSQGQTSGTIAKDFVNAVENCLLNNQVKLEVAAAANEFKSLTLLRNDLLHANPYTAEGGEQRLLRRGLDEKNVDWTISEIDGAALAFENCAVKVNRLFHEFLKKL